MKIYDIVWGNLVDPYDDFPIKKELLPKEFEIPNEQVIEYLGCTNYDSKRQIMIEIYHKQEELDEYIAKCLEQEFGYKLNQVSVDFEMLNESYDF